MRPDDAWKLQDEFDELLGKAVRPAEVSRTHHDLKETNMGSTRWSDDHYRDRAIHRAETGKDAFEYDHAIRKGDGRGQGPREDEPPGRRMSASPATATPTPKAMPSPSSST